MAWYPRCTSDAKVEIIGRVHHRVRVDLRVLVDPLDGNGIKLAAGLRGTRRVVHSCTQAGLQLHRGISYRCSVRKPSLNTVET